ncbi:MAG TPA: POTRA domain-containing protein, partial [Methylotenera sp.]|nr:POTRA domain-containing protein [Methylotenera sp.]
MASANNVEAKPILGRCLGVQGINAVMNRVQNAIIAKGYVTTRVLAAPQDLKAGLLQLTVISGHVGAIRFTPDSSKRISMWNAAPIADMSVVLTDVAIKLTTVTFERVLCNQLRGRSLDEIKINGRPICHQRF